MSGYIGTQPIPQSTQTRETFTATASQTSFATGGYQAGYIDVFLNGVKLVDGTDFTATNGSDVVLTTGAASGDTLEVVAYTAFTVADQTFTGDIVMSDGLTVDNDGATVLTVDRATTDGTIIDVQKGGTTVGSIGVVANDRLYIATDDSGNSGLAFDGDNSRIYACTSVGNTSDNTTDLGSGTQRFKDLYLSGGVYLGGTGAANKLDDYEEGTWTPVISGLTLNGSFGRYTKVGRVVTCQFNFYSSSTTSATLAQVTGFPFSADLTSAAGRSGGYLAYSDNPQGYLLLLRSTSTTLEFREMGSGGIGTITEVSGYQYFGTVVYYTT